MPEPDSFLRYRISAAMQNFITSGKIPHKCIAGPQLQQCVVLKWLYSQCHRNTFVRGTWALTSALLVIVVVIKKLK